MSEEQYTEALRTSTIRGSPDKKAKAKHQTKETIRIDKYKLGEKLGTGAFSTVYKSLDVESGKFVAVKRMKRKKESENTISAEIELLKRLKHPNVVSYIDLILSDHHINIVLEYIDCGSLSNILEEYGVFPETLVAVYIDQLLQGLIYLHSEGVTHRDIKGANILITKDGVIKLADFGIAVTHTVEENIENGVKFNAHVIEASPFYMAPEIIQGVKSSVPTAADIWSLACTIIELLESTPPYYDNSPIAALFRMCQDEHPPFQTEDLSSDLIDFMKNCFLKDPAIRPTAFQLWNHDWIQKNRKPEKKEDWRKSVARIKSHNQDKTTPDTLRSLKNIDWAASPVSSPSSTITISTSSEIATTPNLRMGHRSSLILAGEESVVPANQTIEYIPMIVDAEIAKNFLFSYTVYKIKACITFPKNLARVWTVQRSYSDFQALHKTITSTFPSVKDIPELPKQKLLGTSSPEYISTMLANLRNYLSSLMGIPQIYKSNVILKFLKEIS